MTTKYIVVKKDPPPKPIVAVCKGFSGENPERFWCSPGSPDAKTFDTKEQAETFIRRTGDSSWNLQVARPFVPCDREGIEVNPPIPMTCGDCGEPCQIEGLR